MPLGLPGIEDRRSQWQLKTAGKISRFLRDANFEQAGNTTLIIERRVLMSGICMVKKA
jgi:hypothetical protein